MPPSTDRAAATIMSAPSGVSALVPAGRRRSAGRAAPVAPGRPGAAP